MQTFELPHAGNMLNKKSPEKKKKKKKKTEVNGHHLKPTSAGIYSILGLAMPR